MYQVSFSPLAFKTKRKEGQPDCTISKNQVIIVHVQTGMDVLASLCSNA